MMLLNGQVISSEHSESMLANRSFKYGDALFETLKIYQGNPMFWDDHMARLLAGMEMLKFDFISDDWLQTLQDAMGKLRGETSLVKHGKLRIHVFRDGKGAFYPEQREPCYLVEVSPMPIDYFHFPKKISLTQYNELTLSHNILSGFKTANSLPYVMGAMYAQDNGFDEAVMYCGEFIAETTSANLFVVDNNGEIFTPPLHHGCLPGIMRKQIIRLGKEINTPIVEKELTEKDLYEASEIFLTNSLWGVAFVDSFENEDKVNKISKMIQKAFLQKCMGKD